MLATDEKRFEVVVSDDASKDNAQELLSRIEDPRLRYFRNEKNLGVHKNWEHSLELGRGEWLYLVMGRDKIRGENVNNLVKFLENASEEKITLLKDGYIKSNSMEIYTGIDAMIKFLNCDHPTGTIFSRKIFHEIPNRTKYFEISDMYPENYIKRDSLMKGKGAFIMSEVYFSGEHVTSYDYAKIKSTVEHDKDIYDAYYAPKRRTLQILEIIDMLPESFNQSEKNKFFRVKFYNLLEIVSSGWREICKNSRWQAHYNQSIRHVGVGEMLRNIFTAYNETLKHLREKNACTLSKQIIMLYCLTRKTAKLILKPLGIWSILKAAKKFLMR